MISRGSSQTRAFAFLIAVACALACSLCVQGKVHAVPPCDVLQRACPLPINAESARGMALGTGQRAAAMSTSALAYNPAGLTIGKVYHVEGAVDYMADMKTVALGGAIVDSSTTRLAAAFGARGFLSGQGGLGGFDGRLALAFPFSDAVSIGVTGRYLNVSADTVDGTNSKLAKGFTMDAALRIAPVPEVQLAVIGQNFINLNSAYVPVVFGGSAAFAIAEIATIGADLLVDTTSFGSADITVGGGAEFLLGGAVPLRAGYFYDSKRAQNTISFGIGYTDRSVGFDLALRQQLGGFGDTRLMAAIRYYVH
jgi:hypothetical protein